MVNVNLKDILENARKEIYLDKDFENKVYETEEEFKDKIKYKGL